jgi:hypothetical protein
MSYEDLCLHLVANASTDAAQGAEL